jgi:hypothetical protein
MFFRSTPAFVVAYLLLMVPTYILPYFGSNSSLVNAVSAAVGWGLTIPWFMHAWCLAMLAILTWTRGRWIHKAYLPVFPILAAVFDMTPGLSMVPLIPTVMHIVAIVLGVTVKEQGEGEVGKAPLYVAGVVTSLALLGMATFGGSDKTKAANKPAQSVKPKQESSTPAVAPRPTPTPAPAAASAPPQVPAMAAEPVTKPVPPPATKPHAPFPAAKPPAAKPPLSPKQAAPSDTSAPKKNGDSGSTVRYININN